MQHNDFEPPNFGSQACPQILSIPYRTREEDEDGFTSSNFEMPHPLDQGASEYPTTRMAPMTQVNFGMDTINSLPSAHNAVPFAPDYNMDFALGLPQNIYDSHAQISPQNVDVISPAQADYLHSLDTVLSCQDGMFNLDGSFDFSTAVDYHFHGPLMDPSNQGLVIPPRIFSTLGENGYSFDDPTVGIHGQNLVSHQHEALPLANVGNDSIMEGVEFHAAQNQAGFLPSFAGFPQAPPNMATAELPDLLPLQEFFGDIYRDPFLQSTIRPNIPFPSHPCPIELQWQPSTDMAQVQDVNSTTVAPQETTLLHRPSRSSCPNPGESSYPDGVWETIRPMFRELHAVQKCTLPVTMMILDLVCNFRASEDAFKKRKEKHWPECRKNKIKSGDENQEDPHHQNGSNSAAQQTRPCKVMANYAAYPPYVVAPSYGSIPRTPSPQLYRVQTLLLLSIDKYVKGFFDSIGSRKTDDAQAQIQAAQGELTSDKWRLLWSRCQAISTLIRKKKVFTGEKKKKPLDRLRDNEEMYKITRDMLDDTVFQPPEGTREACSPHILSVLWSICRILQGLPPQMGYGPSNDALFLAPFIQALRALLSDVEEGHNIEMRSLLEYLYNDVSPTELRDTTRISCLCAARALSSRLGPNHPTVLEAWADYHENWDPSGLNKGLFLESYRQAWAECETKHGMTDDRTIMVLRDYASAAYYTCHENGRAKSLAASLWERTWVGDEHLGKPSAWTVKLQTMAEAAKVLALTGCLNHENQRMSRQKLKEMRKELNLRSKRARKRWRQTLKSPPSSNDAEQAIRNLGLAADHLYSSDDRDCKLVAAGLFDLLASLTQEFHVSDKNVDRYRSNAESIRIAVINNKKSIEVSE